MGKHSSGTMKALSQTRRANQDGNNNGSDSVRCVFCRKETGEARGQYRSFVRVPLAIHYVYRAVMSPGPFVLSKASRAQQYKALWKSSNGSHAHAEQRRARGVIWGGKFSPICKIYFMLKLSATLPSVMVGGGTTLRKW